MSTCRSVVIECDIPDCDATTEWAARVPSATTTAEARKIARRDGWHRAPDGDVCPDCWTEGSRPAQTPPSARSADHDTDRTGRT